jgi:large subunit ribosomal protein L24
MRIKKGDTVKIIAGNDRGRTAKVLAAFPANGQIVVEGVNLKKKHVRPRRAGQKGELVELPTPFPISRVMRICPTCNRPTRTGQRLEGGRKARVCKKCGAEI